MASSKGSWRSCKAQVKNSFGSFLSNSESCFLTALQCCPWEKACHLPGLGGYRPVSTFLQLDSLSIDWVWLCAIVSGFPMEFWDEPLCIWCASLFELFSAFFLLFLFFAPVNNFSTALWITLIPYSIKIDVHGFLNLEFRTFLQLWFLIFFQKIKVSTELRRALDPKLPSSLSFLFTFSFPCPFSALS